MLHGSHFSQYEDTRRGGCLGSQRVGVRWLLVEGRDPSMREVGYGSSEKARKTREHGGRRSIGDDHRGLSTQHHRLHPTVTLTLPVQRLRGRAHPGDRHETISYDQLQLNFKPEASDPLGSQESSRNITMGRSSPAWSAIQINVRENRKIISCTREQNIEQIPARTSVASLRRWMSSHYGTTLLIFRLAEEGWR